MAMSIPAASPASSPAPQSPQSSADGSNGPSTPVSPSAVQTLALPPPVENADSSSAGVSGANNVGGGAQPAKRKPSRRANTAERRATHNAVERARRETLNGRFLDLAALLPNLSQIRRPSKSSIVNSSIAHIHASRRHRLLAARELRMLKVEADALRRELNEWRDRSGLPRTEEPVRGEGFQMIMSGEVEILSAGPIEEEDGDEYGDDDYVPSGPIQPPTAQHVPGMDEDDLRHPFAHSVHHASTAHMGHHQQQHAAAHHSLHLQTILPRPSMGAGAPSPMIVQSPNTVSFENPAMASMYDPPHMQAQNPYFASEPQNQKWGMYAQQQQQFTPPASSHGVVPSQQQQQQASYMNGTPYQRQYQHGHAGQRMYGSPVPMDNDDASSVGSAGHSPVPGGATAMKRERSGSMGSVGSNGEMPGVLGGAMGRRNNAGTAGSWEAESMVGLGVSGMGPVGGMGMGGMGGMGGLGGMGMGGGMNGMGMSARGTPMSVGGGGNAFAAMML